MTSKKHTDLLKKLQKHGNNGFAIGWEAAEALEETLNQSERRRLVLKMLLDALANNTLFDSHKGHWTEARNAI
jgi:hypothetical protein